MYLKIKMRNKVIRFCRSCIWIGANLFMFAMGTMILLSIGYAFYQLFAGLLS